MEGEWKKAKSFPSTFFKLFFFKSIIFFTNNQNWPVLNCPDEADKYATNMQHEFCLIFFFVAVVFVGGAVVDLLLAINQQQYLIEI